MPYIKQGFEKANKDSINKGTLYYACRKFNNINDDMSITSSSYFIRDPIQEWCLETLPTKDILMFVSEIENHYICLCKKEIRFINKQNTTFFEAKNGYPFTE